MAAAIFVQTATPRRPMATHRRPSASPPHAGTLSPHSWRRNSYHGTRYKWRIRHLSLSPSTSCCAALRGVPVLQLPPVQVPAVA